jgi:hypothetical protein
METWNLTFTARIGSQNRVIVPPIIMEKAKLKEGDVGTFTLSQIIRKEA